MGKYHVVISRDGNKSLKPLGRGATTVVQGPTSRGGQGRYMWYQSRTQMSVGSRRLAPSRVMVLLCNEGITIF